MSELIWLLPLLAALFALESWRRARRWRRQRAAAGLDVPSWPETCRSSLKAFAEQLGRWRTRAVVRLVHRAVERQAESRILAAHHPRVPERVRIRRRLDALDAVAATSVLEFVAGDAAGLNGDGRERVGLHDLRHSFVANALAAGVTLPEAATLARHANARTTAIVYAGVTEAARDAIAAKLLAVEFGG